MKIVRHTLLALAAFIAADAAGAQGRLENPADGGYASGIALISGWHCDADRITLRVDGGSEIEAAYGTSRRDTLGVCGDSDNGYGFLVNYSNIGPGRHQIEAFADGVRFDTSSFTVTTYGPPFLRRPTVAYVLPGFPAPEDDLVVAWSEAQQGFVAAGYDPTSVPLDGTYAMHRCTVGLGPTLYDSSRGDFTVSGTFEISDGRYTQNVTINGQRFRDTGRLKDEGVMVFMLSDYGGQGYMTLISRGGLLQTYVSGPEGSVIDHWVATDGAAMRSIESEPSILTRFPSTALVEILSSNDTEGSTSVPIEY